MSDTLFKNKNVVISGGSSGIGFELARLFLADQTAKLVLIGSNLSKLKAAQASLESEFRITPHVLQKDLSRIGAGAEIVRELADMSFETDILVNSAGIGFFGNFADMDADRSLRMMDVNMRSLVELTHGLIPGMRRRRFGRILNIASIAAFQAIPSEAVYAATKSFVLLFSEALGRELKEDGIGVTCLCPGPTRTEFFERGNIRLSKLMANYMMNSDVVAKIGYDGLKKSKPLVITGAANNLMAHSSRFLPRHLVTLMAGQIVKARV